MIGLGTIINAACIVLGGLAGLTVSRFFTAQRQHFLKVLLGALVVFAGLRATITSLGGGVWPVCKQLLLVLVSMSIGRVIGRLLGLQKASNRLGQYAKGKLSAAGSAGAHRPSDGFLTCAVLFCVGPMAILGAVQDGLSGRFETLALKGVMDGLAMMAFVTTFGWGALLAVIPVVAYQGTITLGARLIAPYLDQHALLDAVNATGGMLVFTVSLIILEIRKVELADYLPSLAVAPALAWWWGWRG